MKKHYSLTVVREPKMILGVQIIRCREHNWLKIFQRGYIEDLLKKYQMQDCNSSPSPLTKDLLSFRRPNREEVLKSDTPADLECRRAFQAIWGSLM